MDLAIRAPLPELIHYLAVFHRALLAVEAFGNVGDVQGMLMGGHLADALHNVPPMLWSYADSSTHTPASTAAWLRRFPGELARMGAPPELVDKCRQILFDADDAGDLGLAKDLRDLDVAPPAKLKTYLDEFEGWCLGMRAYPSHFDAPCFGGPCTAQARDAAALLGLAAGAMKDLPAGLVRWRHFDEAAFRAGMEGYLERLPVENMFSRRGRA
jgi:hypothetical protein